MKKLMTITALLAVSGLASTVQAAPVLMDFSNSVQADNFATLGASGFSGTTYDFIGVASDNGTTIDARITIDPLSAGDLGVPAGQYNGAYNGTVKWAPGAGEPNGDLGIAYHVDGHGDPNNINDGSFYGINYTISFYDGTGGLSGSFSDSYNVSELSLIIYDVDGSGDNNNNGQLDDGNVYYQAEQLQVFKDGLESYIIGSGSNALALTADNPNDLVFTGDFRNVAETSKEGAVQLNYLNVESVSFNLVGTNIRRPANSSSIDGVFTGVDGSLSIIDFDEDPTNVGNGNPPPTSVSAPEHLTMFSLALAGMVSLHRRKAGRKNQ